MPIVSGFASPALLMQHFTKHNPWDFHYQDAAEYLDKARAFSEDDLTAIGAEECTDPQSGDTIGTAQKQTSLPWSALSAFSGLTTSQCHGIWPHQAGLRKRCTRSRPTTTIFGGTADDAYLPCLRLRLNQ